MAQRIHSIDMVRATALLGILLIHCMQHFSADWCGEGTEIFPMRFNAAVSWAVLRFVQSKAFMLFSFLFGLSFFLQMDHAREKGVDFRARFCWRLLLLFGIGWLHGAFYRGDILTTFAVAGVLPVLLWKSPTWVVAACAAFALVQPLHLLALIQQNALLPHELVERLMALADFNPPAVSYARDSFGAVLSWNTRYGMTAEWVWNAESGRIFAIIGMFLLGLLAGRSRLFESGGRRLLRLSVLGGVLWVLLEIIWRTAPEYTWALWLSHEAYVFFFVPLSAWLFSRPQLPACWATPLASIGRCTLSCYVSQGVLMTALFYGWGLGFHADAGMRICIALGFYALQMLFCTLWLRHFRYGPLEGVWRYLTRLGMKK